MTKGAASLPWVSFLPLFTPSSSKQLVVGAVLNAQDRDEKH